MTRAFRSLLVALVLVASVLVTAPAASAYEPPGGAVFNNPQGAKADRYRIVNTVNRAIKAAKPGSLIYMSMYLMDSRASFTALKEARKRGVGVQLVLDVLAKNGQSKKMAAIFNADNRKIPANKPQKDEDGVLRKWGPDRSFVRFCQQGCRGPRSPNHTKFYVFTATGTAKNVVMVSSSNLNKGGANKGYNDLVILKNRAELVKNFAFVHAEMAEDSPNDKDGFLEYFQGNVIARFYPKRSAGDPVLADLAKVKCQGANGGAGKNGRTKINISMFRWNNDRGIEIARKLVRLDRNGCDVRVIYGAPGSTVADILKTSARNGGVQLWDSRYDFNLDGEIDLRVHHKYMLISGYYGKDRSSWQVHTGSRNWGQSLHAGDENTLNIESRAIYNQYLKNWQFCVNKAGRKIT